EEPGEAAVELLPAERDVLAGALLPAGDHACRVERLQVVAGRRLPDRQLDLTAAELPGLPAAGELAHDLEAYRVGEGLKDARHVDVGQVRGRDLEMGRRRSVCHCLTPVEQECTVRIEQ